MTDILDTIRAGCLTDAGLETWLIFKKDTELRDFASFELLRHQHGRALLAEYYREFLAMAEAADLGFVAETPTWRANLSWGTGLGWSRDELVEVNRKAISFLDELRQEADNPSRIVLSGNIGPRGDGYVAEELMTVDEAQAFHAFQINVFAGTRADMVSAFTITNVPEAMGIVRAAGEADMPCAISFTVETDGRLPSGEPLEVAIGEMDANPLTRPAYYMINCAHPDHFADTLRPGSAWSDRIWGLRANASRMSHAELDACETLDDGDPVELGQIYAQLKRKFSNLTVVGGCCGTDHRHVYAMSDALTPAAVSRAAAAG